MTSVTQFVDLPNEILDEIFAYLRETKASLYPFLYNRKTFSSAFFAIWSSVDFSVRKSYALSRRDPYSHDFALYAWKFHPTVKNLQNMVQIQTPTLKNIRSMTIDLPVRKCLLLCPEDDMRQDLQAFWNSCPNLRIVDMKLLFARTFVTRLHRSCHKRGYLRLPASVREFRTNRPDLVFLAPEMVAKGIGLDMLTIHTDCVECETGGFNSQTHGSWSASLLKPEHKASVFQNMRAFRFEISNDGICHRPNAHNLLDHNELTLDYMVSSALAGSRDSLERLEILMKLPFRRTVYDNPNFASTPVFVRHVDEFPNLKVLKIPAELLTYVLPKIPSTQHITVELVFSPSFVAKDGRKVAPCMKVWIRTLARVKVLLDAHFEDMRKIRFIVQECPWNTGYDKKIKQLYVHAEQALEKWVSAELKEVGAEKMRRWLSFAPNESRVSPQSALPEGYLFVDGSMEFLEKWVLGTYLQ